jgi:hypothetical protein
MAAQESAGWLDRLRPQAKRAFAMSATGDVVGKVAVVAGGG